MIIFYPKTLIKTDLQKNRESQKDITLQELLMEQRKEQRLCGNSMLYYQRSLPH